MPHLILHEHPQQTGTCLESLVRYAQRIPIKFDTLEEVTVYLRNQPFEYDAGLDNSIVTVKDYIYSQCVPRQREPIWPTSFNCWGATAHWLAHALKILKGNEVVDIWDRTLSNGVRHVWPTLGREDGIWLIQLENEGRRPRVGSTPRQAANLGWQDVFGALHYAGAGVLGFFLGSDRAAPIVQAAEKAWGSNIADWSKGTKSVTKAGEIIADYAKEKEADAAKQKGTGASEKKESSADEKKQKPKEMSGTPPTDSKSSKQPTTSKPARSGTGMNWEDI